MNKIAAIGALVLVVLVGINLAGMGAINALTTWFYQFQLTVAGLTLVVGAGLVLLLIRRHR